VIKKVASHAVTLLFNFLCSLDYKFSIVQVIIITFYAIVIA